MATLVLTAVGTAVAGPIGGAIGAMVGQQIDNAVFAPKARQGPRLDDLKIQTSTYGARVPRLFGRVRVAGQVIWSTDLIETRAKTSNGKGRGSTETYSYAASFAVALSARPIARIERVWADGKLLRGAGGDLKTDVTIRVQGGDEDQPVDPLIASAEGVATTPAYRGLAYVVLEGLQLADYGNRIPSLSFEVVADEGEIGVGTALAELAGLDRAEAGPTVGGLAATGDDARAVAEALGQAMPLIARVEDGVVALRFAPLAAPAIARASLGASAGGTAAARLTVDLAPLDTAAAALTLGYADVARDYQPGLQRARREGPGVREERVALPVTVDAATARRLAEATLARRGVERMVAVATLDWSALRLRPGDLVAIEGRRWRVTEVAFERMVVRLSLTRWASGAAASPAIVDPGRVLAEVDLPPGATTLALVDLPPSSDRIAAGAQVAVFAAGASAGWRRAGLLASVDGGASFVPLGTSALPAIMGTAATALAPARTDVTDRANAVEVELLHDDMLLGDADQAALLGGTNRAALGDEIVQFARAEPAGGTRWRLSELWRGRAGSENAVGGHAVGERFVLLDPDSALPLPPELAVPGVRVIATGIGDTAPWPAATAPAVGRAAVPLSPVALAAGRAANGDLEVRWTRRSRGGFGWTDGVDAPLAEEREAYRVTVTGASGTTTVDVAEPHWTWPAAGIAMPVTIAVSQIGAGGVSVPATLVVTLALVS